jgi:peptidyl-prolyl cis-trans isomerase A (cyclophilin A)
MLRQFVLSALLTFLSAPASAQSDAAHAVGARAEAAKAESRRAATVRVVLQTSEGPITLELETERAPATTGNFLKYVDQKRLDGTTFYRATKVAPELGLIQGGVRNNPKRLLPPVVHEPTSKTGLSHVDGAISMARNAPGTATADFFITIGALPSMDANPTASGDNLGFAAFGRVAEGMETVRRILTAPTSPTEGQGVMKGQMLAKPVRIITARRARQQPSASPDHEK